MDNTIKLNLIFNGRITINMGVNLAKLAKIIKKLWHESTKIY